MNYRNLLRMLLVTAALGYVAYSYFKPKPDSAAHAAVAAAIPAHATSFALGNLEFKACEFVQNKFGATTPAFCAPFSVPENRDAPGGRQFDLKLALIRSDAEAADTDIVVYLAGGPG